MQSLMILNVIQWNNVAVATLIFLSIVLLLTLVLLLAKHYLVNSGEVAISINDGAKLLHAQAGKSLLATLGENGVHLSSACGGKGSCGQCKCQVFTGGGDILPCGIDTGGVAGKKMDSDRNGKQ